MEEILNSKMNDVRRWITINTTKSTMTMIMGYTSSSLMVNMEQLADFSRLKITWLSFGLVNVLHLTGLLEWVRQVPILSYLWSLPALTSLAALLRWYLEDQLSKRPVCPDKKGILVTGCDSGYGYLLAKRFAGEGFYVFAGCLFPNGKGAASLRMDKRITVLTIDVTNDQSVQRAMKLVETRLDDLRLQLWAVLANAGIGYFCPLEWTNLEDMQKLFDINVFGTLRTIKAGLPRLRQSKGRVVVTASLGATISWPGIVPYCMSKAAIKNMVEGLRREQASFGVECITVEPGFYSINNDHRSHHLKRFNALPPRVKRDYASLLEGVAARFEFIEAVASRHTYEPLAAFHHAVTSIRPRSSYIVLSPNIKLLVTSSTHFATEHIDAVLGIGTNPNFIKWLTGIMTRRDETVLFSASNRNC
ncbi:11-cis retinol dehydrogenase-like isoform X3 [Varroa destructor]|uniref:Uncharacterized protein n=2 Tax=Varroa destructor TaxID=109461 RepID=A0A7M7J179_VARDE|nr:11-cis retinol dehydrogenase-like isoform X3 [Varroa destructor]